MAISVASPIRAVDSERSLNHRVGALLDRIDYRLAQTDEDREAIFRLRYRAYLREGAIAPNAAEVFSDAYDATGNAWIFGIHIDGALVASLRLHVAGPAGRDLPALAVFPDLLQPLVDDGHVVIDPTRFVVEQAASRRFPCLCYVTTRLAWLACEYFNANLLLATVRHEHQAFYRRVFGHRTVCEPRHYPSLAKPICMMALDYAQAKGDVLQRHPFFRSTHFERRMLFAPHAEVVLRPAA